MPSTTGIGTYMKRARMRANLTRKEAGVKLALHPRSIEGYEYGRATPAPDVALAMSEAYDDPTLTQRYCNILCAIGGAYSYVILNNISFDISSILLKMKQEYQEAGEALERLFCITINKQTRSDFQEHELREVERCIQHLQDLEHNIEILKVQLASRNWFCVRKLVSDHNTKCYKQGYVINEMDAV